MGGFATRENESHKLCTYGALVLCPGHGAHQVKCIFTHASTGKLKSRLMNPTHVPQCTHTILAATERQIDFVHIRSFAHCRNLKIFKFPTDHPFGHFLPNVQRSLLPFGHSVLGAEAQSPEGVARTLSQ